MNTFYGRKEEIKWLYEAFKSVASKDEKGNFTGPRVLALLSESGIGKSRLVQELYCKIANDDKYNPPDFAYWPKQFGDSGVNLNVSPKMTHQSPKGAPKFLWIGARWKPEGRNTLSRDSVFPEIKQELVIHNSIIKKISPAWRDLKGRISDKIASDFIGDSGVELISKTIDAAMPFLGLLSGVLKTATEVTIDRLNPIEGFAQQKSLIEHVEVEEMLKIFRKLLGDKNSIPIVLWLDDAHWADELMQSFLKILVYEAKKNKWPLLIVITHWEREYYEQTNPDCHTLAPREISSLIKELTESDRRILRKIENEHIMQYLEQVLPGLTSSNVELLCKKADGNFLTMVENIGQLIAQPRYFADGTSKSALNEKGVRNVDSFETDRKKRVKQRFNTLDPIALQDVLALGAVQGVRFIPELITMFLKDEADSKKYSNLDIEKCIEPYAILSRLELSADFREFRDNMYADVSLEHFKEFYEDKREKFDYIINEWLTNQISSCFNEHGNIKEPEGDEKLYFINGSRDEKLTLIQLGVKYLDLSGCSLLSTQFVIMAIRIHELDRSWTAVHEISDITTHWNWKESELGYSILKNQIKFLSEKMIIAGAFSASFNLSYYLMSYFKKLAQELNTPESRRDVWNSLDRIARIEESQGDLPNALVKYQESYTITKQLAQELNTPQSRRDVAISLDRIAQIERSQGDLPSALVKYQESYAIRKQLAQELNTPPSLLDLSASLDRIAGIEQEQGYLPSALLKFQESYAIFKQLAEEFHTPQSRRNASISLDRIAEIQQVQGDLPSALLKYQESYAILKQLAQELNTPQSQQEVNISLDRIAGIERAEGDLPSALLKYQESYAIFKQLAEELNTPRSRSDLSLSLIRIAGIEQAQGDLQSALLNYQESYAIRKQLAQELNTPRSRSAVSDSLVWIAEIEQAQGDLPSALLKFQESYAIFKQLAEELHTPKSRQDLSVSLHRIAEIEQAQGDLPSALLKFQECYAILKQLAQELNTPESRSDVSSALVWIAEIEQAQGDLPSALLKHQESYAILKQLAQELNTPESLRDVSLSLFSIAEIELMQGKLLSSLHKLSQIKESSNDNPQLILLIQSYIDAIKLELKKYH